MSHTGTAVIIDLADAHNPNDIHPKNKQDAGGRLAQWALHQSYGIKFGSFQSLYESYQIKAEKSISPSERGSWIDDRKQGRLEPYAGRQKGTQTFLDCRRQKWHWAEARIEADKEIVSSKEVKKPVAARYAFTMNPADANLYNLDGLPAGPFRTDDW